jgi:hypothetical protein
MTRLAVLGALLCAGVAGCGLVDPNITNFDLYIKDKTFAVDTSQWQLNGVDAYTHTDCSSSMGICASAAQQACKEGQCIGRCDGGTGTCQLQILTALWQSVDMSNDNPEINTVANEPVVQVSIDAIAYQITQNTMNVATPEFTVYVAPSTIMTPGNPEAKPIGTIPSVPAHMTQGETSIVLDEAGQANLAAYMGDYMTPFNIIVGAEIDVGENDTVPDGTLNAIVRVRAHAGI